MENQIKLLEKAFLISVEVMLKGYIYYHTYLLNTLDTSKAEIEVEYFIHKKYGSSYDIEYSFSSVCEVDKNDVGMLEKFIDYLPT